MKIILFFFILFANSVIAQSLSVDETIKYLNNLSNEHPGKGYFNDDYDIISNLGSDYQISCRYTISYDKEKTQLAIQEILERVNCSSTPKNFTAVNERLNPVRNGFLYRIDLSEFDAKSIQLIIDKKKSRIKVNGNITKCEFYIPENRYNKWGISVDSMQMTTDNIGYLKVFYNGLKYLVALAKAEIPKEKEENVDDPFSKRKIQTSIRQNAVENKIPLKAAGGVFSLSAILGGKVLAIFILDSGAGECSISSELEKSLTTTGVIHQSDYLSNGLYKIADGTVVENRRMKIPKITIGNKTLSNVVVSIGPSGSPNLLGQSVLKRLDSWSIDNSKNLLIFK